MKEQIKAENLVSYIKRQPIRYFKLTDAEGTDLLSYNAPQTKRDEHIKKLEAVVNSDLMKEGTYFLMWRQSTSQAPKSLTITKGNVKPTLQEAPAPIVRAASPLADVRSFNEALSDKAKIKELELENADLRRQLEDFLSDMEEGESELAETQQNTLIETLKDIGLPLLDRYFTLREQEIQALQAGKIPTQRFDKFNPNVKNVAPAPSPVRPTTLTPRTPSFTTTPAPAPAPAPIPSASGVSPSTYTPPAFVVLPGGSAGSSTSGGENREENTSANLPPAATDEEAQLRAFIQGSEPSDLISFLKEVQSSQGASVVDQLFPVVEKLRQDATYIYSFL